MKSVEELDKRRKRNFHIINSSLLMAVFAVLSYLNYSDALFLDLLIAFVMISLCTISIASIVFLNKDMLVYRITFVIVCLSFFIGVYHGIGKETILYYSFAMPPLLFFYFGKREGSIWLSVFLGVVTFISWAPSIIDSHQYESFNISRYFITIAIVCISSYGIESARYTFHTLSEKNNISLLQEKQRLEKALAEIKTLSGMIPICANCKKIRNDEGFWEQVETYVRDRSEADFSHAICPDCIDLLYPEYKQDIQDQTSETNGRAGKQK